MFQKERKTPKVPKEPTEVEKLQAQLDEVATRQGDTESLLNMMMEVI